MPPVVTRGDRLVYEPSGVEPHLLVGSRRGVPYHSKPMYRLRVPKPETTTFCTPQAVGALLARGYAIDFLDDVWPLVGREVAWWYYRELALGHPGRVAVSWAAFTEGFAAQEWGSEAYERWVAEAVPDPADRFDPAAIDRPLRDLRVADPVELSAAVRRWSSGSGKNVRCESPPTNPNSTPGDPSGGESSNVALIGPPVCSIWPVSPWSRQNGRS